MNKFSYQQLELENFFAPNVADAVSELLNFLGETQRPWSSRARLARLGNTNLNFLFCERAFHMFAIAANI